MLIKPLWQQVVRNVPGEPTGGGAPADPPADPAAATPADPPAQPTGPDLSWLPESFRKDDGVDIDGFRAHYEDMAAAQAAFAEAQAGIPETADGYDLTLPEDLNLGDVTPPEWFKFDLDADNPIVSELKQWMHDRKMPAGSGQELLTMLARYEAGKAAQFHATAQAEMKALGPTAEARLGRIRRTLETRVRDETQRNALLQSLTSADAVRGLEAFISGASAVQPPAAPPSARTDGLTGYARLQAARGG